MLKTLATLLLFLSILSCGSGEIDDPCGLEVGDIVPLILYSGGTLGDSIQMETETCGTIILILSGPRGYWWKRYSAGDKVRVKVTRKKNKISYYVEVLNAF